MNSAKEQQTNQPLKSFEKKEFTEFAKSKGLGAREQEALNLLLQGCSASEVAGQMFIANGTAKAHIRHIYQKLEVNNRDELFHTVEEHIESTGQLAIRQ